MTKSIFITGAASGIGKATAISFAENGWNVGLFDINQEGLKEVAEIIGHNKCMYQKLDVTNIEDWIEAEKSFSQYTGGRCDIFFNNAGIANFAGAFEDIKIEEMNKIIDVNFKGVVNGCFTMLEILRSTENSMLLNTSSVAGLITAPGISVYGATKHAVSSLTENLRIEFERYGIKVSEINPGLVETDFSNVRFKGDSDRAEKVYQGYKALQADDIADIIEFVINRPSHVNIADILVLPQAQASSSIINK